MGTQTMAPHTPVHNDLICHPSLCRGNRDELLRPEKSTRIRNPGPRAAGTTPLVGMRMLDRHNLNIDAEDAGRVVIQAKE